MTKHSIAPSDVNMEFYPLLSIHSFKQKAVNIYYVRLGSRLLARFLPPAASNLERRKAMGCRADQSAGGTLPGESAFQTAQ